MPEIDLQSALETNWIKFGTFEMEAHGDRVIVIQDDFRFGTECLTCRAKDIRTISGGYDGRQASVIECPECKGVKRVHKAGNTTLMVNCSECGAQGWIVCPDCKGTGAEAGLITHPQAREERPTTGQILSVGPRVKEFQRGESVIYDTYSGQGFTLNGPDVNGNDVQVTFVILREDECKARVRGHLELRRVKRRAAFHTAA